MLMRDRRAPLSVLVLAASYMTLVAWGAALVGHALAHTPAPALTTPVIWLLRVNATLLLWRLASRALFTGLTYGGIEAAWSLPRALVGNLISLIAARQALMHYIDILRGASPRWDKTAHLFPDDSAATGS